MNQLWSVAIQEGRQSFSQMFLQPFLAYTTRTHTTFSYFYGIHCKLEQYPGRREVDRAAHLPNQPNPEDWKTTDQPSDRREILY